jgi:hypothetical protein
LWCRRAHHRTPGRRCLWARARKTKRSLLICQVGNSTYSHAPVAPPRCASVCPQCVGTKAAVGSSVAFVCLFARMLCRWRGQAQVRRAVPGRGRHLQVQQPPLPSHGIGRLQELRRYTTLDARPRDNPADEQPQARSQQWSCMQRRRGQFDAALPSARSP